MWTYLILVTMFLHLIYNSVDTYPNIDVDVLKYKLRCEIEWVPYTRGYPIPPTAVKLVKKPDVLNFTVNSVSTDGLILARTKLFGAYTIGSVDINGFADFASLKEGYVVQKSNYEIITNPRNCNLKWVSPRLLDQQLNQNVDTLVEFVGVVESTIDPHPCTVSKDGKQCGFVTPGRSPVVMTRERFQVLESILSRLDVKLTDLTYFQEIGPLAEVKFYGTEQILNKAGVAVTTSTSYSRTKSSGTSEMKGASNGTINGPATFQQIIGNTGSTGTLEDKSQEIETSREILVPAFTSVEACLSTSVPEIDLTYIATAVFSAYGHKASAIAEILEAEGHKGPFAILDEERVETEVEGAVSGLLGDTATDFIVNPVMAFTPVSSCEVFPRELIEIKKATLLRTLNSKIESNEVITASSFRNLINSIYGLK